MDLSKARIILKLVKTNDQQLKGLREIKKRLCMDRANIPVFWKLGLMPLLYSLIKKNTSHLPPIVSSGEQALSGLSSRPPAAGPTAKPVEHKKVLEQCESSLINVEVLVYSTSILGLMTSDYHINVQNQDANAIPTLLPLVQCKEINIVSRVLKVIANLLQIPGPNINSFIALNGPSFIASLLEVTENSDVAKALLTSIRHMLRCNSSMLSEFLKLDILGDVCRIGFNADELQKYAANIISIYSASLRRHALIQILDSTQDLVLLLRVWQDNRENAELHSSVVRIVQNFVQSATLAVHSCSKESCLMSSPTSDCRGVDHNRVASLSPIKEKLVKSLFMCKAATVLVAEIVNNPASVSENIVYSLCTLCDGSLEERCPSTRGPGKSGVALVWMQIVEEGGVPPLVSLLQDIVAPSSSSVSEPPEVGFIKVSLKPQRRIMLAIQALESNFCIQDKVLKHCLASKLIPALTVQFDDAFNEYKKVRGEFTSSSLLNLCVHKTSNISNAETLKNCNGDLPCDTSVTTLINQSNDSKNTPNDTSVSVLSESDNSLSNRPQSPSIDYSMFPLSPLSPPVSPGERAPLVYSPYSPPSSPTASVASSPEHSGYFSPIRSPSTSPPHFMSGSPLKSASPESSRSQSPSSYCYPTSYSPIHPAKRNYSPPCSPSSQTCAQSNSDSLVSKPSHRNSASPEHICSAFSFVKRARSSSFSDPPVTDNYKKLKTAKHSAEHLWDGDHLEVDENRSRSRVIKFGTPTSKTSLDINKSSAFLDFVNDLVSEEEALVESRKLEQSSIENSLQGCSDEFNTENSLTSSLRSNSSDIKNVSSLPRTASSFQIYDNSVDNSVGGSLTSDNALEGSSSFSVVSSSISKASSDVTQSLFNINKIAVTASITKEMSNLELQPDSKIGNNHVTDMKITASNNELRRSVSCTETGTHAEPQSSVGENNSAKKNGSLNEINSKVKIREFNHIKFRVGKRNKTTDSIEKKTDALVQKIESCVTSSTLQYKVDGSMPNTKLVHNDSPVRDAGKQKHSSKTDEKLGSGDIKTENSLRHSVVQNGALLHLETVVRVMSLVCLVKEAMSDVCRHFLPRLVLYLRYSHFNHISAHKALLAITKTPCSIPPLLDTLFPAYVGVQLCEAGIVLDEENKAKAEQKNDITKSSTSASSKNFKADLVKDSSECTQCLQLTHTGKTFLNNMSFFFGHVHQYGYVEARNRLRPDSPQHAKESCILNIPHVTKCPSLLYNIMLGTRCLEAIFDIIKSEKEQSSPRFLYAVAALQTLARTLSLIDFSPGVLGKRCAYCLLKSTQSDPEKDVSQSSKSVYVDEPKSLLLKSKRSSDTEKLSPVAMDNDIKPNSQVCKTTHPSMCMWAKLKDKDIKVKVELCPEAAFQSDIGHECIRKEKSLFEMTESNLKSNECADGVDMDDIENVDCKDEDNCIMAHRSILCDAGGVWAAMLAGGWMEDTNSEVKIGGGVSLQCCRAVIHHLYGCQKCPCLQDLPLTDYVNLLHACHMYGMTELQEFAEERIVQECRSGEDLLLVFSSGVGRITEDIIIAVLVRFIADASIPTWKRAQWVWTLVSSAHNGFDLLHNLYTIFHQVLEYNKSFCTCDQSQSLYMASNSVYNKLI